MDEFVGGIAIWCNLCIMNHDPSMTQIHLLWNLRWLSYDIYRQRGEHLEDLRGTYSFPGPCFMFFIPHLHNSHKRVSHILTLLCWLGNEGLFLSHLSENVWNRMAQNHPKPCLVYPHFPLNLLFFGPWGIPHFWPIHIQTSPGYHPSGPACACSLPFKTRLAISIRL